MRQTLPVRPQSTSPVGVPLQGRQVAGGSGAMFDGIAPRYDLLNRLMTFGIDKRWRRRAIARLELRPGARVLDLATGTADLALLAARAADGVQVVGVDPSAGMRAVGERKVAEAGLAGRIALEDGDAQALRFEDTSFQAVTMGFGIRNVPDRDRALREITRVLRPGGRVAILEATEPTGLLGWGARLHLHGVVPRVGAWLSGAEEYRYLPASVAAFPSAEAFAEQMRQAGLRVLAVDRLLLGTAHLWVAEKP